MTPELTKVIEAISADVLKLTQVILADTVGVNRKVNKNTLHNSALSQDVQTRVHSSDGGIVIETIFNDYIYFIEQGRKPKQGKQPPLDALRDWALSRGIATDNSTLFLISRAIWRDGFEGRPILATLEQEVEKQFDEKWADQLFDAIAEELTTYFE